MTFGTLIKVWREGDEVSQTAFAKKLGLPEIGLIQLVRQDSLGFWFLRAGLEDAR